MSSADAKPGRGQGRIGTSLLGKYRIDRVLGEGGMAVVYAATHRNGSEVALKMLHPELALDEDTTVRFLREGQVANAVQHFGVVRVLDDDIAEDGSPFLVMEMLHGETLEEHCEKAGGRLPQDRVLQLGYQICDVLAAAHAHGIIHRDIKPANVFLTTAGQLKILDFGIARIRDVAIKATSTGVMMGTPAFMAPEQASGELRSIGPATDVFGVGATMYNLATGALPHEGENAFQLILQRATTAVPSLVHALPDATPEMLHVIDRALALAPADRWAGAAEMRDAIRDTYVTSFGRLPTAVVSTLPVFGLPASLKSSAQGAYLSSHPSTFGPVSSKKAEGRSSVPGEAAPAPPSAQHGPRTWLVAALVLALTAVVGLSLGGALRQMRGARAAAVASSAASAAFAGATGSPLPAAALLDAAPAAPAVSPVDAGAAPTAAAIAAPVVSVADAGTTSSSPATATRRRSPARDCTPPYTVDATGTHHWKLECL